MRTVIVRLNGPSGDGRLHGLVEVVGTGASVAFTDDEQLLEVLHETRDRAEAERPGTDEPDRA